MLWVLHGWHRCKAKCILKRFDKGERKSKYKERVREGVLIPVDYSFPDRAYLWIGIKVYNKGISLESF